MRAGVGAATAAAAVIEVAVRAKHALWPSGSRLLSTPMSLLQLVSEVLQQRELAAWPTPEFSTHPSFLACFVHFSDCHVRSCQDASEMHLGMHTVALKGYQKNPFSKFGR